MIDLPGPTTEDIIDIYSVGPTLGPHIPQKLQVRLIGLLNYMTKSNDGYTRKKITL